MFKLRAADCCRFVFAGALALSATVVRAQDLSNDRANFFESKIRPVLIQNCYKCHVGSKRESGLELDSREHLLAGGDRGPAIVPGEPEKSLLIQAIRHEEDAELQMPPKKKLTADQIRDLETWVAQGAAWPTISVPERHELTKEQAEHFAFRPLTKPKPPTLEGDRWAATDIDRFIQQRLRDAGLVPAAPADRSTLIRRASFDLIGLPPTPEEVERFVQDRSADAWTEVVDRLLASPRYGERQARHWLDLVRYAETDGHEFDTDKPNAYQYRDYVIWAFNADLPYDQFVREQIAGDLIGSERSRNGETDTGRPAALGTAMWYLGETQNNPVEPDREDANQVENQLDVYGKTFLGLTIGCARCHDHKFDPIPTTDYYALAGFLYSTEKTQACLDSPARSEAIESRRRQLANRRSEIEQLIAPARLASRMAAANRMRESLLAARDVLRGDPQRRKAEIELAALRSGIARDHVEAWVRYLEKLREKPDGIFDCWVDLAIYSRRELPKRVPEKLAQYKAREPAIASEVFADFETEDLNGWQRIGAAFGPVSDTDAGVSGIVGDSAASSKRGTDALVGRLQSPTFSVRRPYLWLRIGGGEDRQKLRVSMCIHGQPIASFTSTGRGSDHLEQAAFDVRAAMGKQVYLEIVDEDVGGHITVDDIRFAEGPPNGPALNPAIEQAVVASAQSAEALAKAYQGCFAEALSSRDHVDRAGVSALLAWALRDDCPLAVGEAASHAQRREGEPDALRSRLVEADRGRLDELERECALLERDFPESMLAIVARDRGSQDAWVQIRGEYTNRGAQVARGYLSAIGSQEPRPDRSQSGRLQLAEWTSSPANPLTARVIANRVWQHHFGVGLVRSVDNFGLMGEIPSHPELLDYLATQLIESGWSLKKLHRLILLSSVYQQSSAASEKASKIDADNRLLSHWQPRRLEAECIRDAMLATAGNLSEKMYGASVPLFWDEPVEGRDAPPRQGPIDGANRRSIYLEVRRNYLSPLLMAFDFPRPTGTTGQRQTSSLPSQALALLNDDFVRQQAQAWIERVCGKYSTNYARLDRLYLEAFARLPTDAERQAGERFLERQKADYARLAAYTNQTERAAWVDLGHVLLNLGEFVFIR